MPMLYIVIIASLMYVMPVQAVAGEPTEQMRSTIEAVINILKDQDLKRPENAEKRRELISRIIQERFNFYEMGRRSLALHWRKRSPEEREEFVFLFSKLLERSYMKRIEAYTDEEIVYTDESVDNGYAVVKTVVLARNNLKIPMDYRLMKTASGWKVYDVIIEGVSLVNNYRVQFNKIIRSSSFEGLIKRMRDKLEEVELLEGRE